MSTAPARPADAPDVFADALAAAITPASRLVGTPQMALRLGYAAGTAATPRRDVNGVFPHSMARGAPGG